MPPKKTKQAKSANEEKDTKKSSKKKISKPREKSEKKAIKKKKEVKPVVVDILDVDDLSEEEEKDQEKEILAKVDIEKIDSQKKYFSELVSEIEEKQKKITKNKTPKKSLKLYKRIVFRFLLLIAIFLIIITYFTFTKLTIAITPAFEEINDSVQFEVALNSENASLPSIRVVPGEIIENLISIEKVYQTTGEEKVGEEIVGEVIIYNNYTRNQPLVATTRLLSNDDKLFRIKEAVNVPAGLSTSVEVYADVVSPEMAIEPTRFTIPGLWIGLQDQIYAENEEAFVYKSKVNNYVKQADIDLAVNDIRQALKNKLEQEIAWQMRPGDKVIYEIEENNSLLNIGAQLNEEKEDFLTKAENKAVIIRFSQQKAEEILRAKLAFSLPEEKELSSFNSDQITYTINNYNLEEGRATITANFTGNIRLKKNVDFIQKNQLTNLKRGQIKEYLNNFSEIADFELYFSPSFVNRSPHLSDRIEVIIK
jgi:hypothetical protein